MTHSKKEMKQLAQRFARTKRLLATSAVVLTMTPALAPIVANADSNTPQRVNDFNTKPLNTDRNGLGEFIDKGDVSFYQLNGDDAGKMIDGTTIKNSGVSYSNVMGAVVMQVKGQIAYCLQNQKGNPVGDKANWADDLSPYASDLIQSVMALGYPNVSSKSLGVSGSNSAVRAYAVTQIAIWAAENGGKVEVYGGDMVNLSDIKEDNGGVIAGAKALYQRAQDLHNKGGVKAFTTTDFDTQKQKAQTQAQADLDKQVQDKTSELKTTVNNNLNDKSDAEAKVQQAYMSDASSKAISNSLGQFTTEAKSALATAVQSAKEKNTAPIAEFTASTDKATADANGNVKLTFTPKVDVPALADEKIDAGTLLKNKTTALTLDKGYTGQLNESYSGHAVLTDTTDKKVINTVTIKIDGTLPNGAVISQDGKPLEVKNNQFVAQANKPVEVAMSKVDKAGSAKLDFEIARISTMALDTFQKTASTQLTGHSTVSDSQTAKVTATSDYTYQQGAVVGVAGAGITVNPDHQHVGVFTAKTAPAEMKDKVVLNKDVTISDSRPVDTNFKDSKSTTVEGKDELTAGTDTYATLNWDKGTGEVKQTVNTGSGSKNYGAVVAMSVAGVLSAIGAYIKRDVIKRLFVK